MKKFIITVALVLAFSASTFAITPAPPSRLPGESYWAWWWRMLF